MCVCVCVYIYIYNIYICSYIHKYIHIYTEQAEAMEDKWTIEVELGGEAETGVCACVSVCVRV